MTDYILRNRMEKLSLDRWENEGGKPSDDQTDKSGEFSADKQTNYGKNISQGMRDANPGAGRDYLPAFCRKLLPKSAPPEQAFTALRRA